MRFQEKKTFLNTGLNDLEKSMENRQCKRTAQCIQSKYSIQHTQSTQHVHSIQRNKKLRIAAPLTFCRISLLLFLSGCGIYNGGFQRGGEATSSFLERLQENPKDAEDTLLPPQRRQKRD